MTIPVATRELSKLRLTVDEIEMHLRTLEALGEDITHSYLITLIKSKIPREIMEQLELAKGLEVWSVSLLREKLKVHLSAKEEAERQAALPMDVRNNSNKSLPVSNFPSPRYQGYRNPKSNSFVTGALANTTTLVKPRSNNAITSMQKRQCVYCQGEHFSDECKKFPTIDSRKTLIKGRCFICLKTGHALQNCRRNWRTCVYCNQKGKHHRSLCPKQFPSRLLNTAQETAIPAISSSASKVPSNGDDRLLASNSMLAAGEKVLMQTALAEVANPLSNNKINTRILLDCGSQRSYITQDLTNKLGLKPVATDDLLIYTFGCTESKKLRTSLVEVDLILKSKEAMKLTFSVVPKITGGFCRMSLSNSEHLDVLKKFQLADTLPVKEENVTVDVLVGNDYYWDLVEPHKIELSSGLYMVESKLGWMLNGRLGSHFLSPFQPDVFSDP